MLEQRDPKKSEPREKDAAACPATRESTPSVDEEPIEPSSPPCYLHEFSEQAADTGDDVPHRE